MPEAVIVSVARSPIGRANKGSLKDFRPDDLAAQIVRAALDKIPALDRKTVDDLYLGCGLPGGESGFNMGRVVNVINDMDDGAGRHDHPLLRLVRADHPDGVPRDQGRRGRRVHLRRRRDGVAVRARAPPTTSPTPRTRCSPTRPARTNEQAEGGQDWHDPRQDGALPDVYIAMGQTAENVAKLRGLDPRGARRVRRPVPEPRREGDRRRLLGARDHPGHRRPTAPSSPPTTAPAPA